MPEKLRRKRSSLSFKDVQIGYLMNGVPYVEQVHKHGKASSATIRRAFSHLQSSGGQGAATLGKWIQDNLGGIGTRGRSSPKIGQQRAYRVQEIKDGDPFLRLPLRSMRVNKGENLVVQFEQDRIVVWSKQVKTRV
ncbi:MAG: hypothetical protein AAF471_00465 [Myxococcota bacterium]